MAGCHLCGRRLDDVWATATDIEYATTQDRFRYLRCDDCDALSIDPLPADRLAEIYPPSYYSFVSGGEMTAADRNPVTRVKARFDRRAFTQALALAGSPPAPRVLDVGGGSGEIAARLVSAVPGARATVVDIDPESIDAARSRGLDGFAGRIEDYATEERYDLVLMLNLIEHVADPRAVLASARDLLAPGGVAWIQTPNYEGLDARIFRHRNWTGLHCPRHWVVLGERGLRQLVALAGLSVARLQRAQAGSFWATSILGLGRARRPSRGTSPPPPLIAMPMFMPLAAGGAALDLATRHLHPTSQTVAFVRREPSVPGV